MPEEIERIKQAGGVVIKNRVAGCLAVSRAFGDIGLKTMGVIVEPYQVSMQLQPGDTHLIIACDGVI